MGDVIVKFCLALIGRLFIAVAIAFGTLFAGVAETVLAGVANIATCAAIRGIVESDSFTAICVILIAVSGPSGTLKNALTRLTYPNSIRTAHAQIATGAAI